MTNFEQIKNMSLEEMAQSRLFKCPFGEFGYLFCKQYDCDCTECMRAWLESSVRNNFAG